MSCVRFSLDTRANSDLKETGPKVTCNKKFNYFDALIYGFTPFEPPLSFNMEDMVAATNSCINKDRETLKYACIAV